MPASGVRFWENKSLAELSDSEWESLCDGCGRCCLNKLEDEDTGEVHFTDISCKLLDTQTCRCTQYNNRFAHVPDCLQVRSLLVADADQPDSDGDAHSAGNSGNRIDEQKIGWLPPSCAYVKVYKGEPLSNWHPLISGDPHSVHAAGIGVGGRCTSESEVPFSEWEHHLIVFAD